MFLAFQLSDIITVPFGWLLSVLYETTHNYGVAMILFAVIVQLILLPLNAKSKKSMMKMSRLTPKMQAIQQKYADDPQRQNQAIQELQKSEGVSMGGGCLWSFIPILILFPLFAVIRQPITYILMQSADTAKQIVEVIKTAAPDMFTSNAAYEQVVAAQLIPQYASELRAAIPDISEIVLAGINFDFLGINLGAVPQFNVFSASWVWDWAHIGAFLIALTSAACQLLQMVISQKTNDSVITDEKGVQDKETAKNSQQNQSMKVMMWMMPLMSLWIGFTVSAGLSLYWFIGGVVRMISDPIMTSHYRKIYDAEDAVRLQRRWSRSASKPRRSASAPSAVPPIPTASPPTPARRSWKAAAGSGAGRQGRGCQGVRRPEGHCGGSRKGRKRASVRRLRPSLLQGPQL